MEENINKEPSLEELRKPTFEQVQTVMQFADALYRGSNGMTMNGVYTPFTQNQNLLGLNGNSATPTYERINQALSSALVSASTLQEYSEYMAVWDTIYKKTLELYNDILSFDLSYTCINIKNPSEYNSEEYKADVRRVQKFLDRFDYKREFKNKALPNILKFDFYPCWFRDSFGTIDETELEDTENIKRLPKYALQMMPQDYCLITGYSSETIMWDMDFSYFLNPSVDISLYDPSFKRKFREVYDSSNDWHYNPSAQYGNRTGTYANYVQMSPDDGMWAFKFDESNFNIVPPFANLMKATFNNTKIQELQLNKDINAAVALLLGELRVFDNAQSGTQADQLALSPAVVGTFMNLIKEGLQDSFKIAAMPLENSKLHQFEDKDSDMYGKALENSAGQGAFGSSIIYSTGKKGQSEFLNGIIADYNIMKKLYSQFNAFMNFFVNKKTRKYKFKFEFEGSTYPFEREYRRKQMLELADRGIVLNSTKWASVYGIDPQDFERSMQEAKYGGFSDNLMLLLNSNTARDESQVGNPVKDDTQLTDSGGTSREYS